jgi:hypothetical protein
LELDLKAEGCRKPIVTPLDDLRVQFVHEEAGLQDVPQLCGTSDMVNVAMSQND